MCMEIVGKNFEYFYMVFFLCIFFFDFIIYSVMEEYELGYMYLLLIFRVIKLVVIIYFCVGECIELFLFGLLKIWENKEMLNK